MTTTEQLNALQNMANHAGAGIKVYPKQQEDKRRTVPKYFANIATKTISPVLDYNGLNCFLLGFAEAKGTP